MKLRALRPSVRPLGLTLRKAPTLSEQRMAGRALQARRLMLWTKNPCCAACGRLTDWPRGFELDHKVRLADGGEDTEVNTQILCVHTEVDGRKAGCHAEKTAGEASGAGPRNG